MPVVAPSLKRIGQASEGVPGSSNGNLYFL